MFEMFGNRGIYHDGWMAATTPIVGSRSRKAESFNWELYNINDDFSQGKDLAKAMPEKLREMQDLWCAEAGRNNTLPLNFSPQATAIFQKPSLVRGRNSQMPMGATARPVQRGKRKGRVVPGRRAKALSRLALLAPPSWGE
jgi:hypothetical protein